MKRPLMTLLTKGFGIFTLCKQLPDFDSQKQQTLIRNGNTHLRSSRPEMWGLMLGYITKLSGLGP